ncbi:MAG: S-methyl-5-thioribose-1-phosphate isomerase [Deltaproteobacteria bacterium]|jgi:methylthioribose-1-phosphate isomerase|nr:S-methyl-5-thioribose-1-phosphate isomerase [Deltaproteobacteria bacterium]
MGDSKSSFETITWRDGAVVMIDQRVLPGEVRYNHYRDVDGVIEAIKTMVIRGAPAIGCAAGFGVALAAHVSEATGQGLLDEVRAECDRIASARPTAVNLVWAVERMRDRLQQHAAEAPDQIRAALLEEARSIHAEDLALCRRIGEHGAALVPDRATILTHCNAGGLATAGHGTALGVIRSAVEAGKEVKVIADETRPFLQGARLTAWELQQDGIDVTVASDVAAASLMRRGLIDLVVVGTDRTVANGDVANKIGTYGVALAAREAGVPFYVALPWSTVDLETPDGSGIPIEERPAEEVTHVMGQRIVPEGVPVLNPAFDVTPAELVTALITDRGVIRPPYDLRSWKGEG